MKLGPRLATAGWDVEHLAVGGLRTRDALIRFPHQLPATQCTLLSFGSNDAAPWKRVPPEEFGVNLGALIERCRSERVLLLPPLPVEEQEGLRSGRTNELLGAYAAIAREVAHAREASMLELLEPIAVDGSHHVDDGVHLNDAAYAILAKSVLAAIRPDRRDH